ncbi:TraB/GumN family protein [Sagittula salina]|uniref:TraB/GumN family protein n=1 Tax=Sagittula salina TaxID=2820268 RepID=A0A940MJ50_9RHOB|nr:TraB/GumN family protein [Sagittula salina]MBP0482725.1 TraB/GumN family protein [Sagittula salina]
MIRLTALLLFLTITTQAHADCRGQDLTQNLAPDLRDSLDARLIETPYAQGNHWIATKDGATLHLIGTMHLTDPRLDGPTARLSPLLDDAALLLLEMTAADKATMETSVLSDPTLFMLKGASLPDLLPEDEWQALAAAMEARGVPAFVGARMQPWYLSMLLSVPACMKQLLEQQDGLDFRLEDAAEARGLQTRSLEPWDTFFGLFADIPLQTQLAMIRAALTAPEVNEDLFTTMLDSYFDERSAEGQIALELLGPSLTPLTEEENAAVTAFMNDSLLARRNAAWMPVLKKALANTESPVIAAFGAAHLPGKDGILNLLEEQGFTLTRAPF